jgi:hypothetical protein
MGMERVVTFSGAAPSWPAIRARLAAAGLEAQMRMIDNLPAFPDEEPEEDWQELRLGLAAGMVTVCREPRRICVIVWGNADPSLQRDQEAVVRACAEAGAGVVS